MFDYRASSVTSKAEKGGRCGVERVFRKQLLFAPTLHLSRQKTEPEGTTGEITFHFGLSGRNCFSFNYSGSAICSFSFNGFSTSALLEGLSLASFHRPHLPILTLLYKWLFNVYLGARAKTKTKVFPTHRVRWVQWAFWVRLQIVGNFHSWLEPKKKNDDDPPHEKKRRSFQHEPNKTPSKLPNFAIVKIIFLLSSRARFSRI